MEKELTKLIENHRTLLSKINNFLDTDYTDVDWAITQLTQHPQYVEFVRDNADLMDWKLLSSDGELSESFMREFADRLDWTNISTFQYLSEPFMREFADRLDLDVAIEQNWEHVSDDFIADYYHQNNWSNAELETILN